MRFSVTRDIEAPPQVVWELLTRASAYPEWNPAVLGIEGEIAEGETIRLKSVVDPDRRFKLKVSDVAAPRHMVWSDGMPLGLFRGARSFDVEPRDDGASQFRMEEVYTGLMAPLITRSIPDMTESFEMFADGLKSAAESK
ncbi:MAG TPA: SRPBCC domain-containing protein [Acidimicrobiia bacterium]|nr:SRPBCC domain-containing protein [Acidimicrobiia bacterium]